MGIGEIIIGILMLLFSIAIILIVLMQQGRSANISGAISGGADTFFDKDKAKTVDTFLSKSTKFFAFAFFILAIVANAIIVFA